MLWRGCVIARLLTSVLQGCLVVRCADPMEELTSIRHGCIAGGQGCAVVALAAQFAAGKGVHDLHHHHQ